MIYEFYEKYQKKRNIFLPLNEALERAKGKTDVYSSIFGYNEENIETGDIYGPLYFDLDSENDLKKAHDDTQTFLSILGFYGVTEQDYQLSFSGNKGFHLIIYPQVLNIKPAWNLDKFYKQIASWFLIDIPYKTLDMKVYERRRLWRIVNTKHGKSGLYKIPITGKEKLEQILKLAKVPQPIIKKTPKVNQVLKSWVKRAEKDLERKDQREVFVNSETQDINPRIMDLINLGISEGNRNQTAFYINCYLKSKGIGQGEALAYVEKFAKNCTPQMSMKEVISTNRSAYERSI